MSSISVAIYSSLEWSQLPPNLGLNALQGVSQVLGGRLQGKPHGVHGGFREDSGGHLEGF